MPSFVEVLAESKTLRVSISLLVLLLPLAALVVPAPSEQYTLIRVDYAFWASTLLAILTVLTDMRVYRGFPIYSTLILEVVGIEIAAVCRLSTYILSVAFSEPNSVIVGFGGGLKKPLLPFVYIALIGLGLTASTSIASALRGRPAIFGQSITAEEFSKRLRGIVSIPTRRRRLTAFLVGFLVRLVPEVSWWPWPIGFDTVEYIAHLRDFAADPKLFGSYYWMGGLRNVPPLLDWILYPFTFLADPWTIFKFYPPVVYGLTTLMVSEFASRVLKLGDKYAILASIISVFNIAVLRASWDLQKQMLGGVFTLASLIYASRGDVWGAFLFSAFSLLSALSTEVGAASAIIASAAAAMYAAISGHLSLKERAIVVTSAALTAAVSYVLLSWYMGVPVMEHFVLGVAPPVVGVSVGEGPRVVVFLLLVFGPLIPAILGGIFEGFRAAPTPTLWLLVMLFAGLAPLIAPYTSPYSEWDRVFMYSAPLISAYAAAGLRSLSLRRAAKLLLVVAAVLPGSFFVFTPQLSEYASAVAAALPRMPSGLNPMPDVRPMLEELMFISYLSRELIDRGAIACGTGVEMFIHLAIRNPEPARLIVLNPEPTYCSTLMAAKRYNISKIYAVLYAGSNSLSRVRSVECPDLGVILTMRTVYRGAFFEVYEVDAAFQR